MGRKLVGFIMLAAALCAPAQAAGRELTSTPYGVVDLGDRVAYRVSGADCEATRVHVRVIAGDPSQTLEGPGSQPLPDGIDPSGCTGAATVPSFADVRASGWRQGDPIAIELMSDAQSVPLRYFRAEADRMATAAGAPTVGAADDPDSGPWDTAITLASGDAINAGRVNVRKLDSISVRLCVPTGVQQSTVLDPGLEERHEAPLYASVRQGSVGGPALLGPVDIASNLFTDGRLDSHGFGHGCWRLLPLPFTGTPIEDAPELYFVIEPRAVGTVSVSSIDFNGSGAKIPGWTTPAPAGMETIFDGTSFAGWTQTNCALRDGAATNSNPGPLTGCSMAYDTPLRDVIIRLDLRRENFFDNGAIMVPKEIQVRSAGEYLPGGYFGEYAARAEKFNVFPDWSQMEIVQIGRRYVVTLNGRTVTDHLVAGSGPGAYRIQLVDQPEWSYRYGVHGEFGNESPQFVMPSDWGHVWWDNVRIYRCAAADDPVCVAAADARLGQAPKA